MKLTAESIAEAIEDAGFEPVTDYSGRFMYGKECPGFSSDSISEVFLMFTTIAEENPELAHAMAKGAKTDSMGRGMIVYWPNATYEGRTQEAA